MRSRILQLLISLICFGALFFKISNPVISTEDKWFATLLLSLLYVVVNRVFGLYFPHNKDKVLSDFYLIVLIFCSFLSVYGIFQKIGIFSLNSNLGITGNFDNPAGYASSLCAGFPTVFYFLSSQRTKWMIYVAATAGVLISIAVVLSESRAGMLSIAVMTAVWFFLKRGILKRLFILSFLGIILLITVLYFYKKDSADGRLLIWQCSWEMIKEKPLLGYGTGGFRANYMNYQADYFKENPESPYIMLADNTNRPFNEYILLLVNYGLIGFLILGVFIYFLWKSYRRNPCTETKLAATCLIGIAVFSCFSYPLSYPFVWVMLLFSMAIILIRASYRIEVPNRYQRMVSLVVILVSLIAFVGVAHVLLNQINWGRVAKNALVRQTDTTFARYNKLLPRLKKHPLFLYNYAAELNYGGYYSQSQEIATQCERRWADYDLQLLMGYNYIEMRQYQRAEAYFKQAAYMCPVRFTPLYELMKIYRLKGAYIKEREMAAEILAKPVKVPSRRIEGFKKEANQTLHP